MSISDIEAIESRPLEDIITQVFIADFCRRFSIVNCVRAGKKSLSVAQIKQCNKNMAFPLGEMHRAYAVGLKQEDVENYDETYFCFDMEDGRALYLKGTDRITYSELSSGRDNFTVRVSQLFPELDTIFNDNMNYFNGLSPDQ